MVSGRRTVVKVSDYGSEYNSSAECTPHLALVVPEVTHHISG